jgi:hypothetical protein
MLRSDLKINAQASKTLSFTLKDEDGVAIDITGASILMTAKLQRKDASTDATFSKAGSITSATAGTFTVALTPTETNQNPGVYFYDVVVTISSDRYTASSGRLTIEPNITVPTT